MKKEQVIKCPLCFKPVFFPSHKPALRVVK